MFIRNVGVNSHVTNFNILLLPFFVCIWCWYCDAPHKTNSPLFIFLTIHHEILCVSVCALCNLCRLIIVTITLIYVFIIIHNSCAVYIFFLLNFTKVPTYYLLTSPTRNTFINAYLNNTKCDYYAAASIP